MLNAISWCHIQAGYTSVQLALEQKHEATVEVLLEAIVAAGMDIDARYESRRGGFGGFGAAATSTEQGQTLLMRASALGLTSTAAKLLALGADIAAKDAVLDNVCFSFFQFFFPSSLTLKHTHIRTQEGNSCLHIAAAKGNNEILCMLLNAGAKVSAKNEVDR